MSDDGCGPLQRTCGAPAPPRHTHQHNLEPWGSVDEARPPPVSPRHASLRLLPPRLRYAQLWRPIRLTVIPTNKRDNPGNDADGTDARKKNTAKTMPQRKYTCLFQHQTGGNLTCRAQMRKAI
eukprot:gene11271-biopygen3564